jgi:hypothetical protein
VVDQETACDQLVWLIKNFGLPNGKEVPQLKTMFSIDYNIEVIPANSSTLLKSYVKTANNVSEVLEDVIKKEKDVERIKIEVRKT